MSWKDTLRRWAPPALLTGVSRLRGRVGAAPWEVARDGWRTPAGGWNVDSVAAVQEEKWHSFGASLRGTGTVGVNHEVKLGRRVDDLVGHNLAMVFGYVLVLATRERDSLRVLDWGGGIGHYYLLAKALLPGVSIDYSIQDVPRLAEAGRRLLPEATFFSAPEGFRSGRYDLVIAVSSLWYVERWRDLVDQLLEVCDDYLYVSRMTVVDRAASFAAIQRPWAAGYRTEYVCWIFNRDELVCYIESRGATLLREFVLGDAPYIQHAPQQGELRGFLFRKVARP